jgi:hypothetical protein
VFSASEILAGDSSHETGCCRIACFIAAVFCSDWIENAARSFEWDKNLVVGRLRHSVSDCGKDGRGDSCRAVDRIRLAKFSGTGGVIEHTRLVELIVLNIAYNAHVFSPELFTMLVIMALVTTMMTVPILNWLKIGKGRKRSKDLALPTAA